MNHPLQLDLMEARRRRDRGITRVSGKNMAFIEHMRQVAVSLCKLKGQITIDDLRVWHEASHERDPTSQNAWGVIFKDKRFKPLGFTPSRQIQGHGRIIRVWGLA